MNPSIDRLIAFENDDLSHKEMLELFSDLIKSGMAYKLQGFYGRTALILIDQGYLDESGNILNK